MTASEDQPASEPKQSRRHLVEAFRDIPKLETTRLTLRELRADDAEDMFAYARDPEMTHWVSWEPHRSITETRSVIQQFLRRQAAGQRAEWALVHRADRKMIGTAGFRWNECEQAPELGYTIARRYWNQGLMTEAIREITRYGFEEVGLERIVAKHASKNPASGRVLMKAGMHCDGPKKVGQCRPIHYSLTREQFLRRDK